MKYRWFYYRKSSLLQIALYRIKLFFLTKLRYCKFLFLYSASLNDLKKLKNSKKGKSAFVFANGPSLNRLSKKKIKECNFDIFAMNKYINSNFPKPNFYVISDIGYFVKNNIEPENASIYKKILKKNIKLFVPATLKNKINIEQAISFCDVEDVCSNRKPDPTNSRNYFNLTALKTLSIATYLGYSKIYICGFDNTHVFKTYSDINNNLFYKLNHFYKSKKKIIDFIKFGVGSFGQQLHNDFCYLDMDLFADLPQTKIINLDSDSLITCFDKKTPLDIFKKK